MGLRNLPTEAPARIADLVACRPGQVSSMALSGLADPVALTLLAFSAGEEVSEEVYGGDTLYLLAEGEADVTLAGRAVHMAAGDVVMVPAGVPSALYATHDFKLLQLTLP